MNIKSTQEIARIIAEAAAAKKALDITVLDIRDVSILADYFVICSGSSSTQVKSIADEIKKRMREIGYVLDHVEGYKEEKWILLDYLDVVVHVFHAREREFYNLEKLWGDARVLAF
ncbi:MAG TPA: ribosome silencing factor [Bacillota bacterium]|nr:ribosome silencing factor [Bacillota bacterium]HQA47344.1 ribosome silencing factor [Bacillota bacterium]HQD41312.1 ribosome silencing factor [Bacillota bacterium]